MKELVVAIDSLKNGKSADSKGIKAEDLNGGDEETTKKVHQVFIFIIKQNSMTPSSSKKDMVAVICKKRRHQKTRRLQTNLIPPICLHCEKNRLQAKLDRYQFSWPGRIQ